MVGKFKKEYLINIVISLVTLISFFMIIKIDNESRLPININTDYHMNSLPYIYAVLIGLCVLIIFNLYKFLKVKKQNL